MNFRKSIEFFDIKIQKIFCDKNGYERYKVFSREKKKKNKII